MKVESSVHDITVEFLHVTSSKRNRSKKHDIETHTCAPHVNLEAAVAFTSDYFWGDVSRSTALIVHNLFVRLHLPRHSKITNLDSPRLIEQDVV